MAHGSRTVLITLVVAGALGWLLPRRWTGKFIGGAKSLYGRVKEEAAQRPKIVLLLIWIVALIPMIHLTAQVHRYGVNVPVLDDWAIAPLIVKAHTGELKFADIFVQQQEARTVLPKLIFILASRGHWDVRDQMMLSVICCWLSAAGIFILLRRSGLNLVAVALCFWLAVLAIFSAAQFELWIFASGFPSFMPALFLVAALVTIDSRLSTRSKFVICVALALASSFTLSHGLLAWVLTFPVLLLIRPVPRWRSWLAGWVVCAALCAAVYFWGYEKPSYLPSFAPAVSLLTYVDFILQFLGGGLAYASKDNSSRVAAIFGLLQLAIYLLALAYTIRRLRERAFLAKVLPWFVLGLYALASAFLAALGRVGFGAQYALASRYVPFSLYLTLAVIALVAIIATEILTGSIASLRRRVWVGATCLVLLVPYLAAYKHSSYNTLFFLRSLSATYRLGRGAVLFSPAFDTSHVIKKVVHPPGEEYVIPEAAALDRLQLLKPPLVRTNRLNAIEHQTADGTSVSGACEVLAAEGESYRASGWALLKAKGRQADCIVIAYEVSDSEPVLFAISDSIQMRWDIARRSWPNDYMWSGWTATFPATKVPPGATLSFWAVDADEPRLYRLAQ